MSIFSRIHILPLSWATLNSGLVLSDNIRHDAYDDNDSLSVMYKGLELLYRHTAGRSFHSPSEYRQWDDTRSGNNLS